MTMSKIYKVTLDTVSVRGNYSFSCTYGSKEQAEEAADNLKCSIGSHIGYTHSVEISEQETVRVVRQIIN